jgi:hypothetical protein
MYRQLTLSVIAVLALVALPNLASAQVLRSAQTEEFLLNAPIESPSDAKVLPHESIPDASLDRAVPAPAPAICCPQRCVTYKHHGRCKRDCRSCVPSYELVLGVKDPCVCGCIVPITLCVPGCCTDVPSMTCHRGLLGRQIVEYRWCCGYKLKVIFDRRGDVTVHTFAS